MKSLSIEVENIIKNIRNIFREKKELNFTAIKDKRKKSFQTRKKTKVIKGRIIRDIKNLSEHEEEYYHKAVRVSKFWSNNYTEYEINDDGNKTL